MTDTSMYDQFSKDYDRFVNWEARLSSEIPFLSDQLEALRSHPGNSVAVLDAASGTGQHLIALSDLGFACTGADFSKNMVEKARMNANEAGHDILFKHAGFGELSKVFD